MKTIIKNTKTMGRGVFANQAFKKKQLVEESHCISCNAEDDQTLQNTGLRFYVFSDGGDGCVLALGNGSLFNHDRGLRTNVTYQYDEKRNMMKFYATRSIRKGEQLFINYGYNPVDEIAAYEEEKKKPLELELKVDPPVVEEHLGLKLRNALKRLLK